jgi:membrane associated rhomboid family serine protease
MKYLKKIQYNSPVVLTFALVSLAVLLLGMLTGGVSTDLLFCVYRCPLTDPLGYLRLFGHVLGHVDLEHYMGNMMLFLLLGPMVEEKYGSKPLAVMLVLTALITGLVHILFSNTVLLGASGLVFMLIVLSSMVRFQNGRVPLTMILVVVLYLGQEVYDGIMIADGVSQLTHVLGGVCGGVFGWILNTQRDKLQKWM